MRRNATWFRYCRLGLSSLVIVFVTLIQSGISDTACALGTAQFRAYPTTYDASVPSTRSWFIYNLARSQSQQSSITVVNITNALLTLELYPVDATTTNSGSFALLTQDELRNGVGAWITLSKSQVTLAPSQTLTIPFQISIPANASVGAHNGGIAVQETSPIATEQVNGGTVHIISRVGIRVYETVPGQATEVLRITNFSRSEAANGRDVFMVTLSNTGNTNLTPSGMLTVKNVFDKTVEDDRINVLGMIAPSRSATYEVSTHYAKDWPERFSTTVAINYGQGKYTTSSLHYFVYSWYDLGLPIGAILVIILVVQLKKRFTIRRR